MRQRYASIRPVPLCCEKNRYPVSRSRPPTRAENPRSCLDLGKDVIAEHVERVRGALSITHCTHAALPLAQRFSEKSELWPLYPRVRPH